MTGLGLGTRSAGTQKPSHHPQPTLAKRAVIARFATAAAVAGGAAGLLALTFGWPVGAVAAVLVFPAAFGLITGTGHDDE